MISLIPCASSFPDKQLFDRSPWVAEDHSFLFTLFEFLEINVEAVSKYFLLIGNFVLT